MEKRVGILFFVLLLTVSAAADSLFNMNGGAGGTLISQRKVRFEVGDIITVLVKEDISASTKSTTNTRKEADVETQADSQDNTFLVADTSGVTQLLKPERLPNWKIETNNEHRGRGETTRTNSLETTVSCVVTKVYENGNIRVEGGKQVTVNREDSILEVSGVVRAEDVAQSNTVESGRLADATIRLRGCGPLWNNQRRGIFTKIIDWFSPF